MRKFKILLKVFMYFFIPMFMITGIIFVSRNKIGEKILETSVSEAAGAKAEVEEFYINPRKFSVSWKKIQIADKKNTWENLIETGECSFDIELKELFKKNIIINELNVKNVMTGTKRKTDGKLISKGNEKQNENNIFENAASNIINDTKNKIEEEKKNIPILNLEDFNKNKAVDDIIKELGLKSPPKIEEAKNTVEEKTKYWDKRIKENDYEKELKLITYSIDNIKKRKVKDINELLKTIEEIDIIIKKAENLKREIKADKELFDSDIAILKKYKEEIPVLIEEDYERVKQIIKLQDVNVENIAKILFGERIGNIAGTIFDEIQKQKQTIDLISGNDIVSADGSTDKADKKLIVWVKKSVIEFTMENGFKFSGIADNISNNQEFTKNPIVIKLKSEKNNIGTIDFEYISYKMKNNNSDEFKVNIDNIKIKEMKLSDSKNFPKKIISGKAIMNIKGNIAEGILKSNIKTEMREVIFDYSEMEMNKKVNQIIKSITNKIKIVNIDTDIIKSKNEFKFSLKSNLDKMISDEFKNVLQKETENLKKEVEEKVKNKYLKENEFLSKLIDKNEVVFKDKIYVNNETIEKENKKIEEEKEKRKKELEEEKEKYERKLKEEKKEIEEKIEKEKKELENKIESDLKKGLKKLKIK